MKVCQVCGFLLSDDDDFCPMCGWKAKFRLITKYNIKENNGKYFIVEGKSF